MLISDWSSDVCSSDLHIPSEVTCQHFGIKSKFNTAVLHFANVLNRGCETQRTGQPYRVQQITCILDVVIRREVQPVVQHAEINAHIELLRGFPPEVAWQTRAGSERAMQLIAKNRFSGCKLIQRRIGRDRLASGHTP